MPANLIASHCKITKISFDGNETKNILFTCMNRFKIFAD